MARQASKGVCTFCHRDGYVMNVHPTTSVEKRCSYQWSTRHVWACAAIQDRIQSNDTKAVASNVHSITCW